MMGSITCRKTQCKYNKPLSCGTYTYPSRTICKRGSGYDYGGGDIEISERGFCKSYEKIRNEALKEEK